MARIRSIKPEFWTSEQIVECSTNARLLFIGLWNFCDDGGVHPASIKRLKMEVFPGDPFSEDQISEWVSELRKAGLVSQYSAEGQVWWAVTGWHHQKIDRPSPRYPAPQQDDNSTTVRRPFDDHSPPEGKGVEGNGEGESNKDSPQSGDPPPEEDGKLTIEEVVQKWNRIEGVNPAIRITAKRRKSFNARLKDNAWVESLDASLERVAASAFLRGENDRGWSADLEWFLRPDTQTKILEGKYDNKKQKQDFYAGSDRQLSPEIARSPNYPDK